MKGKIFCLGLLALGLFAGASCSYREAKTVVKSVVNNQGGNDEAKKLKKYVMGEFSLTNGTDFLIAPIYRDYSGKDRSPTTYASSEYGESTKKGGGNTNNYVIMNRQSLASRKLFTDNKFAILDTQKLGESGKEGTVPVINNVKALLFRVVKADTNKDNSLDGQDKQIIALADVDGNNYKELIVDIDRVINIHSQSKDKRVVFYQSGNDYFTASIDIPSRSVQSQKLISIAD
jgi:hypothetical protein